MLFHFVHQWGEIKDGYQYCKKCGIGRPVACSHIWTGINHFDISAKYPNSNEPRVIEHVNILKCTKCGEMKEFRSGV